MPSVGYLYSLRCPFSCRFGKYSITISGYTLDTRVNHQPTFHGLELSVFEQFYWSANLQIH